MYWYRDSLFHLIRYLLMVLGKIQSNASFLLLSLHQNLLHPWFPVHIIVIIGIGIGVGAASLVASVVFFVLSVTCVIDC